MAAENRQLKKRVEELEARAIKDKEVVEQAEGILNRNIDLG